MCKSISKQIYKRSLSWEFVASNLPGRHRDDYYKDKGFFLLQNPSYNYSFLQTTNTWSCVRLSSCFTACIWRCLGKKFLTCHMLIRAVHVSFIIQHFSKLMEIFYPTICASIIHPYGPQPPLPAPPGNTEAFPGQLNNTISSACCRSAPRPPSSWKCPKHLPREASSGHPNQMPKSILSESSQCVGAVTLSQASPLDR